MTLNRSRPLGLRLALPAYLLLLAAACGSSTSSGGDGALDLNGFGQKYKLADNEVSGWTQSTKDGSLLLFTPEKLVDKIDGAATPYVNQGMQFAMYQILNGPNSQTCNLTAMYFPTEAKAKAMLAERQDTMSASLAVPGYSTSVASASQALTGITVFAAFRDLYLEVVLDGFGSDADAAGQAGAKFLQAMEAKTK
jgi:hypothetical protein